MGSLEANTYILKDKRNMKLPTQPDSDRPLSVASADLFGFVSIAKRLAPAILNTFETDGMVVGLEGAWGSGKTTLLNFLKQELDATKNKNIHCITISPWLSGDEIDIVSSLLNPIADILDKTEVSDSNRWRRLRRRGSELGNLVRTYSSKTGRTLAPAARLAEYFVPGAKVAGDTLELGSQYLEKLQRYPTISEVKSDIAKRISAIDIGFIVMLDDLDRLEPRQAVEVIRLVRSVADFPKITYIMCYDREVLSDALNSGLNIENGDQFLQKIIQATYNIPLPEPFDLRQQFLVEAMAIYEQATGSPATGELLSDLKAAVDREGSTLQTPREVKLALNSLRFIYLTIKDDVYFPDACRVHLIKTVYPALHRWIERYLSVRSVLVTGDATVGSHERAEMGRQLRDLLPADDSLSALSIWNLLRFIPGVTKNDEPEHCVFSSSSVGEIGRMIRLRRLGSPIHYRYYFALTYPKTVIPEDEFRELLALATRDTTALTGKFLDLSRAKRTSGKSWFEHVLDRLDDNTIDSLNAATLSGLIEAISYGMDAILTEDNSRAVLQMSVADLAERVVCRCLKCLKVIDSEAFLSESTKLSGECPSLSWLIGHFFRSELFKHGIVGDRPNVESSAFDPDFLSKLLEILKDRATKHMNGSDLQEVPDLAAYLYGWRDLSGLDEPKEWVAKRTQSDEGFLSLLDQLRSWSVSDRVYYPLRQSDVSVFLDWDVTERRLEELAETGHEDKARELQNAVRQGR